MKQFPSHFVAHIGPGWSDRKHDVCLIASDSEKFEYDVINHSPETKGVKQYAVTGKLSRDALIKSNNFTLAIMAHNFPEDRYNRITILPHFEELMCHSISA